MRAPFASSPHTGARPAIRRAPRKELSCAEKVRTERIEITVVSADNVMVNSSLVPRRLLSDILKPLLAASATKMVAVRCNDDVPHGTFVSVLDEAKHCGASQIAVIGG